MLGLPSLPYLCFPRLWFYGHFGGQFNLRRVPVDVVRPLVLAVLASILLMLEQPISNWAVA